MKKLIALILALVLSLSLVACGGPDKQPAIEAFNKANTAFTEVANAINANPAAYPEDVIDSMIELSDTIAEHKELLESDTEISEEDLAKMIEWYAQVEELMAETKKELGIK